MDLRSLLSSSLLLLLPLSASAMTLQSTDDSFSYVQKSDRFEFGNSISLSAPFSGDILAAGQTVTIDEPVDGTVQAAGQTVILNTTIGRNVRVAGNTIIIRGTVNGSVLAMGSDITLQEGAQILGDLTVLGGSVTIDGTVGGDVLGRAERMTVSGTIRGAADLRGKKTSLGGIIGGNAVIAGEIMTNEGARIQGNLRYWSPKGQTDFAGVVTGTSTLDVTLKTLEPSKADMAGAGAFLAGAIGIFGVLSAAFALLVIIPLMPKTPTDAAKHLQKHPWHSVLMGLLFFIGLPMLAIVLTITVFGIPLAVIVVFKFIAGLILASVIASLVLVRTWQLRYKKTPNGWVTGILALLLYIVLKLLNLVPVVGWIVSSALVLMGFGAFLFASYEKMKKML